MEFRLAQPRSRHRIAPADRFFAPFPEHPEVGGSVFAESHSGSRISYWRASVGHAPLAVGTGVCQRTLGWHIGLLCFLLRFGIRVCRRDRQKTAERHCYEEQGWSFFHLDFFGKIPARLFPLPGGDCREATAGVWILGN